MTIAISSTRPSRSTSGAEAAPRQLITFVVAGEEFGVDILRVQEINRLLELTRVPQAPPEVEGVVNLRGRIIPVIDLAKRFNLPGPRSERTDATRIVVVEVGGRTIGFIVDRVREVLRLEASRIEPAPGLVSAIDADYVVGVGKLDDRLVILLDLDRLFAGQAVVAQIPDLQQAASAGADEGPVGE